MRSRIELSDPGLDPQNKVRRGTSPTSNRPSGRFWSMYPTGIRKAIGKAAAGLCAMAARDF